MRKCEPKKETRGSWISRCRLSTREPAKESGDLAKVRFGTRKVAKVARMEERNSWQKGNGKKGGTGEEKGGKREF